MSDLLRLAAAAAVLFAATGAGAQQAGQEHKVNMTAIAYAPKTLSVKVGDTILFVNNDPVDHDVFIPTKDFAANLGTQKPGTTTSLTVGRAGTFDVECVLHENMKTKVTVSR
jgi:plastocyanin